MGACLDITHTAATPVGMRVTARAVLTGIDGRRLMFHIVGSQKAAILAQKVSFTPMQ